MGLLRFLILEPVVNGIIVLSTIALVMLGFTHDGAHFNFWVGVDVACVVFFALEVIIKIGHLGWSTYWSKRWNKFDFFITLLCLPVLLMPFTGSTRLITGAPMLRLFRLFRLFRLLRFIPERDRLSAGVTRALKASVAVFLAVMLVNFIFAMGAHVLFANKAPAYFSDPARAVYSMFQVFTVEGWYEIPRAIAANSDATWSVIARVYFGFAVLIGGILGLSLGNAVFVDQMTADNTDALEDHVDSLSAEISNLREEIRALRADLTASR